MRLQKKSYSLNLIVFKQYFNVKFWNLRVFLTSLFSFAYWKLFDKQVLYDFKYQLGQIFR